MVLKNNFNRLKVTFYSVFSVLGNVAAMYRTADNLDGTATSGGSNNTSTTSTQSTNSDRFRVGSLRLPRPRRPPARDRSSSDRSSRRRDDEGNVDYQLD